MRLKGELCFLIDNADGTECLFLVGAHVGGSNEFLMIHQYFEIYHLLGSLRLAEWQINTFGSYSIILNVVALIDMAV